MNLDPATAQIASTVILAAITVHIAAMTALQYDTRAGRITSVAYLTVTGTGVLTSSLHADGSPAPLGALAAAGVTLSFGLLWSGLRLQQLGGSPRLRLAFVAAGLTAVSSLLSPVVDRPVPLALSVVLSAAFTAACGLDSLRGPYADRPPARVLQSVMAIVTATIVVVAGLIGIGLLRWTGSIDVTVATGTTIAFALSALCVTSMRADEARLAWWGQDGRGIEADFDLADDARFRRDAADRIERSVAGGAAVGLVWIEIDQLDDLAVAFGHHVRDSAIVHVGRTIRAQVPPFALIGHLGDGRFVVLTTARARRPVERVANAVRFGLDQRHSSLPVLVSCRIGTSVQGPTDIRLDRLLTEARTHARTVAPS